MATPDEQVYSATYSSVPVYEFKINGENVMRRRADDWINATHILKVAGFDKPARTRILEREVQKGIHEKVQGGYGKYQGTWVPLAEGRALAQHNNIFDKLRPIFDFVAGDTSPPPAPKHTTAASKPRAPRLAAQGRRVVNDSVSFAPARQNRLAPSQSFGQDYDMMSHHFPDDESIAHATMESSSVMADEDLIPPMSQQSTNSRKRKRQDMPDTVSAAELSAAEQAHIIYGDELLDYFLTNTDAPSATRQLPPEPPVPFFASRAIDDMGNTALHWACSMGDLEIVQDLLNRGANQYAKTLHDETPLVRAVLFTNNHEKSTMPALINMFDPQITHKDWFGASIFHHIAVTTRSRGKWRSARYYCEVLVSKLKETARDYEFNHILCCQDNNGDTAACIAARNGCRAVAHFLMMESPRCAEIENNNGQSATDMLIELNHREEAKRQAAESTANGNGNQSMHDADGAHLNPDASTGTSSAPVRNATVSRIVSVLEDAQKKLTAAYGKSKPEGSEDLTNPRGLYEELEAERQKLATRLHTLSSQDAGEPLESELKHYEQAKLKYESYLERLQRMQIKRRLSAVGSKTDAGSGTASEDPVARYQAALELYTAQKNRRAAVQELIQQRADAGAGASLDKHRKLVALATGLPEEELDPMATDLAASLEFDRTAGSGKASAIVTPEAGVASLGAPDPDVSMAVTGPDVSVDA